MIEHGEEHPTDRHDEIQVNVDPGVTVNVRTTNCSHFNSLQSNQDLS
jgi:hypothetical protein